jgi:hypothetical protein
MNVTLFVIGRWEDIARYCNLQTTEELKMNVTVFVMKTVGRYYN